MNWTEGQRDVIEYRGDKNLLVSAAAGSGKTAVLVERVIQRILDKEDPLSVDEILVLTFTNAAAAEMKNKISAAIEERIRDNPDDRHLAEQAVKLGSADISTIHAFAKKVLTNNIHKTDIPADFSLMDDSESAFLFGEALDDCLERYYGKIDKLSSFSDLTMGYGGVKNDNNLRYLITDLYNFSRTLATPEKWLNDSADMYKTVRKNGSLDGTIWKEAYISAVREILGDCTEMYNIILDTIRSAFSDTHNMFHFYNDEARRFSELANFETIDEFLDKKSKMVFDRAKPLPKADREEPLLVAANKKALDIRNDIKKKINDAILFKFNCEADIVRTISDLWPRIRTLKNITLMVMRRYRRLKLKRGEVDFSDLEHYLVELLMDKNGTPKDLCLALRKKYKEIYVDEYQDTNNIQDTLFALLSGDRGNVFMVGDIKQSIYRFRAASPGLFIEKYENYAKEEGGTLRILSHNFRSRKSVIEPINELFGNIMYKKTAGIDYTEEEALKAGAVYPDPPPGREDLYTAEILMTNVMETNPETGKETTSPDKTSLEARAVAERICRLVYEEKLPVYDSDSGETRPVEFGDIAVLFRSTKSNVPVYESEFLEYGIPVMSETGGFLESVEIQTVLAFLSIIDNPLQDIPLLAVMRSPMFGFTADELADIRAGNKKVNFYIALLENKDNPKTAEFLETLDYLRKCAAFMGIDELIYKICYDTDYIRIVGGMKGGAGRQANLKLLLKTASAFEGKGLSRLFEFMKYLERMSERGELRRATSASQTESAVLLTTIHKSKGLEYPVVILADTVHFNTDRNPLTVSEKLGIGLPYVDVKRRLRYPSFPQTLIRHYNSLGENAEEMRLLYVALTRAREKLIISCTNAGHSKNWKNPIIGKDGKVINARIESTTVFRDWIVYGFINNENISGLRKIMDSDISHLRLSGKAPLLFGWSFGESSAKAQNETETRTGSEAEDASSKSEIDADELEKILAYEYPGEMLTKMPLKMTVSEIKNSFRADEVEEEWEYTPRLLNGADRTFHSPSPESAAEIGTITHFALRHIDPQRTGSSEEIDEQLREMEEEGILSKTQLKAVRRTGIARLFKSKVGDIIKEADRCGKLLREVDMLFPVKASEIYPELENTPAGDADIIVQGIADCVCLTEDGAVLIDYKTDRCTAEQAPEKAEEYRVQIECYTKGLEGILKVPVKERILYFLTPGRAVEI